MFNSLSQDDNRKERISDEVLFASSLTNPSLFSVILDRYQMAFLRKAEYIIKDADIAEDIVQDTFVKIYRRAKSFTPQGEGSFRAWAYRVLMNTAFTRYQKEKVGSKVELSAELAEILPDEAEEEIKANMEMKDYITSVLSRMPAHLSEILNEFFIKGKSQEEIANENNLSVGAVKVRIYRAKESFRQMAGNVSR